MISDLYQKRIIETDPEVYLTLKKRTSKTTKSNRINCFRKY